MQEVNKKIRQYAREGWSATKTGGGHIKMTHPDARNPVFIASTPSESRSFLNAEAEMRRALQSDKASAAKPSAAVKPAARKGPPKRPYVDPFVMPQDRLKAATTRRMPRRHEWAPDNLGKSQPSIDPRLILRAWAAAILRERATGIEWSTIRALAKRMRTDLEFRNQTVASFQAADAAQLAELRQRHRTPPAPPRPTPGELLAKQAAMLRGIAEQRRQAAAAAPPLSDELIAWGWGIHRATQLPDEQPAIPHGVMDRLMMAMAEARIGTSLSTTAMSRAA